MTTTQPSPLATRLTTDQARAILDDPRSWARMRNESTRREILRLANR